jgi:hypothetical protein
VRIDSQLPTRSRAMQNQSDGVAYLERNDSKSDCYAALAASFGANAANWRSSALLTLQRASPGRWIGARGRERSPEDRYVLNTLSGNKTQKGLAITTDVAAGIIHGQCP